LELEGKAERKESYTKKLRKLFTEREREREREREIEMKERGN
jgi:hypothetical protein